MARKRSEAKLHRLATKAVLAAGDGDHSDGGGLMLRVRGAHSSWVFRFTSPAGKRREMGMGAAYRSNAAQAGAELTTARELSANARKLLAAGIDPIDHRGQSIEAAKQAKDAERAEKSRERWTLARAARDYHERVIEPSRTPKHAAQWIASLENHMPASIWNAPIASIEAPALLQALSTVRSLENPGQRIPETLTRVRQRLDAVFDDAMFHNRCAGNPAAAIKRKMHGVKNKRNTGEFAALPYRDAPAFMARLRAAQGISARCLELAVLTAARTAEVLYVTWSEIDLERATWTVPGQRMKAGEPHFVPLSARAVEILQGQRGMHNTLVFPSFVKPDQPMSNMAMLAVLDRLGVRHQTTVHGLCRATFSTWANETAAARPDVIEACLAHSEADRVRSAYNRAEFTAERRALMDAWADYLMTSNVLQLRAA
ncbi:MAG: tyrosine-type recombinase/integrase [Rhodoferax sp.]|nr:tyrosine-type recombinase/integrase [Rhodoferax sp.]